MAKINVYKVMLMNFISSLIIAVVTCDIFYTFGLKGGMYLGDLFGLYFLVIYGVNNMADAREIPTATHKFILIIALILIFDALYLFVIPLIFGPNAFPAAEIVNINLGGSSVALRLSKEFYMVLFAVVMLIFNLLIHRRNKDFHHGE
jgi:hypothetical protein